MREIFVFGSNRLGIHGAGAALYAHKNHGAILGQGEGLQGDSYAIPTKDTPHKTLPLEQIAFHVNSFLYFAIEHPELKFRVTRIGCGYAGYTDADIAPMFLIVPENVELPEDWQGDKYHPCNVNRG